MGWFDGETELWKHYAELHAEHLALRMVAMTMISMLPSEVRQEIIARVSPVLHQSQPTETPSFTLAVHALLDELRDELSPPKAPDHSTDVVL